MKSNKQGSALLIVLGFLSFMVVSAVAFAIYMRAERMPSSALRRAVATRHLVKAALAEAISRVDDAVRDDAFPGFCATNNNGTVLDKAKFYYFRSGKGGDQAIDVWDGRVFMPPDPQGGTINAETRYAPVSETVSVLTLEGLGYLPPALVNDVRFLSRSSWAASWQPLPFDSGRFAYCAVNVSDYLDVNRVSANRPRTSEPLCRISAAPLFDSNFNLYDAFEENNYKGKSVENPGSAASAFDEFTGKSKGALHAGYAPGDDVGGKYENWKSVGNSVPYVSMMDFNLALGAGGPNSFLTPLYYNWLANKREDKPYYISQSSEMSAALRQPFIADSWSYDNRQWATGPDAGKPQDILTDGGHPFYGKDNLLKGVNWQANRNYFETAVNITKGSLLDKMEQAGYHPSIHAFMWDYLDHDDYPLSLALPCVERVPMIAGLSAPKGIVKPEMDPTGGDGDDLTTWTFTPRKWFNGTEADVLVAFPFKHGRRNRQLSCEIQLMLKVAYIQDGALAASDSGLRQAILPTQEEWSAAEGTATMADKTRLVFTFLTGRMPLQSLQNKTIRQEAEAVEEFTVDLSSAFSKMSSEQIMILERKKVEEPGAKEGEQPKKVTKYVVHASPLTTGGAPACDNLGGELLEADFEKYRAISCRPHLFIWARVVEAGGGGKTVDLAPAGIYDDFLVNKVNEQSGQEIEQDFGRYVGGQGSNQRPVFEFVAQDVDLSYEKIISGTVNGSSEQWQPEALYAVDPRFNSRPEHWYGTSLGGFGKSGWLQETHKAMKSRSEAYLNDAGSNDRPDSDIFMFTSNIGMLQSLGEFAFLPNMATRRAPAQVDARGDAVVGADSVTVMTQFPYLWHTYDARDVITDCTERNIAGHSLQKECLVNPHTDNLGVMMAALANTPIDYWAAACNVDASADTAAAKAFDKWGNKEEIKNPSSFSSAKQYMFSSGNTRGAQLDYDELVDMGKNIMFLMGGLGLEPSRHTSLKDLCSDIQDWDAFLPNGGGLESRSLETFARFINSKDAHEKTLLWQKELIRGGVHPSVVWQRVWDFVCKPLIVDVELPGDSNSQKNFLGTSLGSELHSVDRKFLYSYWRDCFANNQQLVLVFVRAESSALGGPGEGTPAQLGGRAVALVWRDPDWSEGNGDNGRDRDLENQNTGNISRQRPHRTRVLFYHQFD